MEDNTRFFDILISASLLLVFAPLLLIIACLIMAGEIRVTIWHLHCKCMDLSNKLELNIYVVIDPHDSSLFLLFI